jgi:hypothetical protein
MTVRERIIEYVGRWPGKTQREIAQGLFGSDGRQQRVNSSIALLVARRELRQVGYGGNNEPFRYYPAL